MHKFFINSMEDRYNIIENTITENEITIQHLEDFIEHFLIHNHKIFMFDKINQYIYFNKDPNIYTIVAKTVLNKFEKYILISKDKIIDLIHSNYYSINEFNSFIKEISEKLIFVENLLTTAYIINNKKENLIEYNHINSILTYISSNILSNHIIKKFLSTIIVNNTDLNTIKIVEDIITQFKIFEDIYFSYSLYSKLNNIFFEALQEKLIDNILLPISDSFIIIYTFRNSIELFIKIYKAYYSKIKNNILNIIASKICNMLINIIDIHSINVIDNLINEVKFDLDIIFSFNNSIDIRKKLCSVICYKIILEKKININIIDNCLQYIKIPHCIEELTKTAAEHITNKCATEIIYNMNRLLVDNNKNIIKKMYYLSTIINKKNMMPLYIDLTIERLTNIYCNNCTNISKFSSIENILSYENKIYNEIIKYISCSHSYIIKKLLYDVSLSLKKSFYNIYNKICKTNISTLLISYNTWNIVYESESYISTDNEFENTFELLSYIHKYSQTFSLTNKTKNLSWYLHYGEVEAEYENKIIKLLPIQYLILEFFTTENETIPLSEILNCKLLEQYSKQYISNTINSLISGNILLIHNNNLIINNTQNFSIDLINIYNLENLNNTDIIVHDLAHEDRYIVLSNIIKIVKHSPMNYNDLFNTAKNNIKVLKLSQNLFNSTLEYMIDMNYIEIQDDIYRMYNFV